VLGSSAFAPGCENNLLLAPAARSQKVSLSTDSSGNTDIGITTTYQNGSNADTTNIVSNSSTVNTTTTEHSLSGAVAISDQSIISGSTANYYVSGNAGLFDVNNASIQLSANSTATLSGNSNILTLTGNDTSWLYGSANTCNLTGSNNASVVYGTYETTNEKQGTNNQTWDYGSHDTNNVASSGNLLQVFGSLNNTNVAGSANTTWIQTTNQGSTTISGSAEKTVLNGGSVQIIDQGAGDTDWVQNSSDTLNINGNNTVAYVENNNDVTWERGSYDLARVTGNNDVTHRANATDGVSDTGSTDYYYDDWDGFYGSGDPGGGYGGYYGYYGVAGNKAAVSSALGSDIGGIARQELAKGHGEAANAAQRAHYQVAGEAAIFAASGGVSGSVMEAAMWDHKVITWSLADAKGDTNSAFSAKIDPAHEASVKKAFDAWAAASGLTFKEVADSSASNIRIGWSDLDTADTGAVGYTTFKAKDGRISSAQIRLEDPTKTALTPGASGTYAGTDATFQQVVEHEIGHAIGLGSNADPTSIMFYELGLQNRTLGATDRSGAQAIYGNAATLQGNGGASDVSLLIQGMSTMGGAPAASTAPLNSTGAANDHSLHPQIVNPSGSDFVRTSLGVARAMAA
jgi:hypothetical protein